MSRPRTDPDKPGWLRVRVRCPRCGGGWFDWLPDGASLRVLQVAADAIDCPECSRLDAADLREAMAAMAEEDEADQRDGDGGPVRPAGALA